MALQLDVVDKGRIRLRVMNRSVDCCKLQALLPSCTRGESTFQRAGTYVRNCSLHQTINLRNLLGEIQLLDHERTSSVLSWQTVGGALLVVFKHQGVHAQFVGD